MKCKIPEISWHNRDPVLSVDTQPKNDTLPPNTMCRLASGGTDAHVLIWYVKQSEESGEDIELELAADLSRHQRAVNTVRWSPDGELLASGDDESFIFIWKQKSENEVINIVDAADREQDREVWLTMKVLRGHVEDVYDLCWSPNSKFLLTGSVDNTAMIWDVHSGKSTAILSDHKGYVQGVAWDPYNKYLATLCTDRVLRIFDNATRHVIHRVSKSELPVPEGHELHGRNIRLYHDGSLQTFFRRLCFTPDGKMLLTPAGVTDYDGVVKPTNTTYGFSRYDLSRPAFALPFPSEYTVAVRCSPVLYSLRPYNPEKNPPMVALPYRMIYAVATRSSVFFFDTQQKVPFGMISNIHYTRLTDLTWSNDGNLLIVSSTDGFCSLVTFAEHELGERYDQMDAVLSAAAAAQADDPLPKKKARKPRKHVAKKDRQTEIANRQPLQEKNPTNQLEEPSDLETVKRKPKTDVDADNDSSLHSSSSASTGISPKPQKDSQPVPIAIRRSPRKPSPNSEPTRIAIRRSPRKPITDSEPQPIAVKRKLNEDPQAESQEETESEPKKHQLATLQSKPIEAVLLDKEIISSDEKFESPEKHRPATPIQVRRQPRTPCSSHSTASNSLLTPTTLRSKHATPIEVRRTPRVVVPTPIAVNAPVVVEEAMDAWPLAEEEEDDDICPLPPIDPKDDEQLPEKKSQDETERGKQSQDAELAINEVTCERTEDIRLVYEDTQEEQGTPVKTTAAAETSASAKKTAVASPSNKTPRRVSLRTISTPKSKKKLVD